MGKLDAVKQSPASILANAKNSRKQYDKMWNAAARAPIFCKITKKTLEDGKTKKFYRTARLIGSHAYMIAASGAAAYVAKMMERDCSLVHEDTEQESARAPWMPQVSKGAKMVLEQWMCALSQEATKKGHAVRQGAGAAKRLNNKHMKIGWDVVHENVFSNTAMLPRTMYVAQPAKKVSKSSKKGKSEDAEGDDEDYSPPEDEAAGED
jgi:hypothetical protein